MLWIERSRGGPTIFAAIARRAELHVHELFALTLIRRGYYDVRLEGASLPYSFNGRKRGVPSDRLDTGNQCASETIG